MIDETYGTCPLMGRPCPGASNCAPAQFHSTMLHIEAMRAATDEEAASLRQPAICPIVRLVDATSVTASALLPLVLGDSMPEPPEETPEVRRAREAEEHRRRVIEKTGIDKGYAT